MAVLDFPIGPVDGQQFVAPNGVVYQWSATYGLWTAVQPTASSPTGDFMASAAAVNPSVGSFTTILWPTVALGNNGNYYNPVNGRFTPPAGRYLIAAAYSGYSSSAAVLNQLRLRKNGVAVTNMDSAQFAGGTNQWAQVSVDGLVDANGTDYFEMQGQTNVANSGSYGWFYAFPISGVRGPPGPGVLTGDFSAWSSGVTLPANVQTVLTPAVINGNSPAYYNPTNGRFTPPAGRYNLKGGLSQGNTTAAILVYAYLLKNGTAVAYMFGVSQGANNAGFTSFDFNVDANGTDYFQIAGYVNAAGNLSGAAYFTALSVSR